MEIESLSCNGLSFSMAVSGGEEGRESNSEDMGNYSWKAGVWSRPKWIHEGNGMGAYERDRTDAVAGPMNVRKRVREDQVRALQEKFLHP